MSLFATTPPGRRKSRDEAEKPFWISFSDLMTALMVLFLVAMTVALLAITHEMTAGEQEKADRDADIQRLMQRIGALHDDFPGITIRGQSIDFGDRARFASNSHQLDEDQARLLRAYIPRILALASDPLGQRWLKRISVEGFADPRGGYLHNLNLSLQRSERVLCVLLAAPGSVTNPLTAEERRQVRELFHVAGASFNARKDSDEASRRIEMRLEFLERGETRPETPGMANEDSTCPLDHPR